MSLYTKHTRLLVAATVILASAVLSVLGQDTALRDYRVLLGDPQEMEFIANTGVLLNKVLNDAYFRGFGPRLPKKIAPVASIAWSVFWTYSCSLWPHEFGHWARARQTGGDFIFEGYSFPFPAAKMVKSSSYDPAEDGTLSSVGGFEINFLMRRQTHTAMYRNGYAYADELIHSFIQEVYFPFYAFVVAFPKTSDPYTWTNTRGDPVESALAVYKSYTKRNALRPDSTVDPELVDYYWEAIGANLICTLLDPMLYKSARAFGVDMKNNFGLMKPWMAFSGRDIGWTYGTAFNPSPLGYELYFTNYLNLAGKLYTLYLKAGRPYKNLGIGFYAPDLLKWKGFALGSTCDFWIQDVYGNGSSVDLEGRYRLNKRLVVLARTGRKDRGYVVGRKTGESLLALVGLDYSF